MRRRGFSLIEMLFVLSVLGILSTLAVPRLRATVERADAAALIERIRAVQLAYEEADTPAAAALPAGRGVLPDLLREHLATTHFSGEAGVTLGIGGTSGNQVILLLFADGLRQQRVLAALHRQAPFPHRYAASIMVVPLNATAIAAFVAAQAPAQAPAQPPVVAASGGGAQLQSPSSPAVPPQPSGPTGTPASPLAPSTSVVSGTVPAVERSPVPATGTKTAAGGAPPATGSSTAAASTSPSCSRSLPPGQYRHCLSNQQTGYFRNHNH